MEDTRRTWHTESTNQGTYGLRETEVANTGLYVCVYAVAVSLVFIWDS